jgi:hypothetical protein
MNSAKRSAGSNNSEGRGHSEEDAKIGPLCAMAAASFWNAANLARGLAQFKIAPLLCFC